MSHKLIFYRSGYFPNIRGSKNEKESILPIPQAFCLGLQSFHTLSSTGFPSPSFRRNYFCFYQVLALLILFFWGTMNQSSFALESKLNNGLITLVKKISHDKVIGVVYIKSQDPSVASSIFDEMELILTENRYIIINRDWEVMLPYFHEYYGLTYSFNESMNEDSAIDIGKFMGVDYIISGNVVETTTKTTLRLQIVNVQSRDVVETVVIEM